MEVSCQFHILLPLLTFGYEAGWGPELVRTLGMGNKSNSVVVQPVAKSVYLMSSPGMQLLNVGVCVCVYTVPLLNLSPSSGHFGWVMSVAAPFPFVGSLLFIIEVVRSLWAICSQCLDSTGVYFLMIQTAVLQG